MHKVVSFILVCGVCLGRPNSWEDQMGLFDPQERAVANPKTPNQILDAIAEGALGYIKALGWDVSKNVQNGNTDIPLKVDSTGDSSERFEITSAQITGLGSLRRSKSGTFMNNNLVVKGTFVVENVRAKANYKMTFAGAGEAPAQTVTGIVTEKVDKLFADIEVDLLNLVPQSIKSFDVRSGHDILESVTNMNGNSMQAIHKAGFRKALRQILEDTMASNMKVQINKAIQDLKNAA